MRDSAKRIRDAMVASRKLIYKPRPTLTISEWANKYAFLSPETSATVGRFESFKYQDAIMDACGDPAVKQVVFMKASRVGYTRALDNIIAYYIAQDPSPILVVQPRIEDAEDYSKTEIAPMIRDTPSLSAVAGDMKMKDSGQTLAKRMFRNGASITFVGANSPAGFRRITARVILFDEADAFPVQGAGVEGDQISLGIRRGQSFWNRRVAVGSTPTIKGASRIERMYEESDKRRYWVPCPHCNEFQVLKFSNLQWDKKTDADGSTIEHYPETAYFLCEKSGCIITEDSKKWMIDNGSWRAENEFKGIAGFHLSALYSLFPNAAWGLIAAEFLRSHKDPVLYRTFVNTVLAELWEDRSERIDGHALLARLEAYTPTTLPAAIYYITVGTDTQPDRLEVSVFGWGAQEESWLISHEILRGSPAERQVWDELDYLLKRQYWTEDGRELRIRSCCIDSGGSHTAEVIQYATTRHSRMVFATKGAGGARPIWPGKPSRKNDKVFVVGTSTAKSTIYSRLRVQKPGPAYIHLPTTADEEYCKQLTSEVILTKYKNGIPYKIWDLPSGLRNECLDCAALALAALRALPVRRDYKQLAPQLADQPPPALIQQEGTRIVVAKPSPQQQQLKRKDSLEERAARFAAKFRNW